MMIAGLLSLFSIGFLAMSMGGVSPFAEPETEEDTSAQANADTGSDSEDSDATPIVADGTPPPSVSTEDDTPATPEDPISNRPPAGEAFRDPQVLHEEAEAAAAIARAPETLLIATDANGEEVADESLLRAGPLSGEDADRDYLVVPPVQGETDIDINYHPDTTFLIALNEGVQTVEVGLNSNIEPAAPRETTTTEEITGADGTTSQQITQSQTFDAASEITFNVSQAQIGTHVAKIDLSNPGDTLHFNFDGDIRGNLHLVTNDVEQSSVDGSLTERTMYVIESTANLTELTPYQIGLFIEANGAGFDDARMVAEIYLGEDGVNVEDGDTIIRNFMNDAPQITTNATWSSQGVNDGTTPQTPNVSGGTLDDLDLGDLPFGDSTSGDGIINLFDDTPELDLSGLDQDALNDLTEEDIRDLVDFIDTLDLDGIDGLNAPDLNAPQWGGLGLI